VFRRAGTEKKLQEKKLHFLLIIQVMGKNNKNKQNIHISSGCFFGHAPYIATNSARMGREKGAYHKEIQSPNR